MKWLPRVFVKDRRSDERLLRGIQHRFGTFLSLLDANNRVLKLLSDLEEKAQGEHFYDLSYIRSAVADIRTAVREIIESMITLGGSKYEPLRKRFAEIDVAVETALTGAGPVVPGAYTIRFGDLSREEVASVGSKNAQLGELRTRLGLLVPDGFAISAWAYKQFIDANRVQRWIDDVLTAVDARRFGELVRVSEAIQRTIVSSKVPADLARAIRASVAEVVEESGATHFALRSSALAEDDLLSFAGQYRSRLNVPADAVVEGYREILAGKFTPQAIFYLLSHAFRESDLAMCVGCVAMVDAVSSGVVYTRDPVHPADDCLVVNSVFGLGQLLVSGAVTPDVFRVRRDGCQIAERRIAWKPEHLVMSAESGTTLQPVAVERRDAPSLDDTTLYELSRMALEIERHYGVPQDLEWALDRSGRLFLLQTRPLQVLGLPEADAGPELTGIEVLLSGGTTVCTGAGCGLVHHVASMEDLSDVPAGCVLVAPHPFPGLVSALPKISALGTEIGGLASHTATLAREYRVPTIMGLPGLMRLPRGSPVTLDATEAKVYAGEHQAIVRSRWVARMTPEGDPLQRVLRRALACLSPLNLLYSSDPGFRIENCYTVHDITRFCHQKSMQELFERTTGLQAQRRVGLRLRSEIPLRMNIVCLERDAAKLRGKRWVNEEELISIPMKSFWSGIRHEGWPGPKPDVKGFDSARSEHPDGHRSGFSEDSYAVLGREYMVVSLRMGYHFTTVEALSSSEPSKNFIYMQYKEGGASLDRRMRRLQLITTILTTLGFRNLGRGDTLDSRVTYLSREAILRRLHTLGRLMIMTKQLDMVLASDSITEWYTNDLMERLGLRNS
jgi:pyruvate,water dikinase